MNKAVITIIYDNEEMFSSIQHILHCLDCEAFQVTTEVNREYTPEQHQEELSKVKTQCITKGHHEDINGMCPLCDEQPKDYCECELKIGGQPEEHAKYLICISCHKPIKPTKEIAGLPQHLNNKPKFPPIPTTNMNSFQAVWDWNRKLKEYFET